MRIKFKKGNYYFCKKDYIISKELAFERNRAYECIKDNILKGLNNKLYCFSNIDVEDGIFTLLLKKEDNVNSPKHYTSHPSGIECIQIARHYCFSIGNAIKYLWRAGLKQESSMTNKEKEIEDLKKAIWYINDRINQLEEENGN